MTYQAVLQQIKTKLAPLKRYQALLLVMAVGALLLWLPTGQSESSVPTTGGTDPPNTAFSLEEMETKLSKALSKMEGVGNATVLLTLSTSGQQIIASDCRPEGEGTEHQTVILSGKEGESVVTLQEIYPIYQGALVVCDGGGDPGIRLRITQAVGALTGLGSDKISICQGK